MVEDEKQIGKSPSQIEQQERQSQQDFMNIRDVNDRIEWKRRDGSVLKNSSDLKTDYDPNSANFRK